MVALLNFFLNAVLKVMWSMRVLNPEDEVVTHSANVNHKPSAKAFTCVVLKSKVLGCGYAQCKVL